MSGESNVTLSASMVTALEQIAKRQGISWTEALARAVGTQDFLTEQAQKGAKILIDTPDRGYRQVDIGVKK